jgi:YidC/Oxa1 family membrane protein insertase
MGFLSRVRSAIREKDEIERYFAVEPAERPVTVYAEDDYSWNQLAGYVQEIVARGRRVAYVTSQDDDPLRESAPEGVTVFHVAELVPEFLPKVDSPVFATTMPDLDRFHVKRPSASTCVYFFHSLNSTHMAYRGGAFDAYDVLATTGPYQKAELGARYQAIGKTGYRLEEVGYYKLDRIAAGFREYEPEHPGETTVLVAPSWGPENLLASCGVELVQSVAAQGFRTIVRPHPAFFESVYAEGRSIVDGLREHFAGDENVLFETSITSENAFYEASLVISDWSGAALEFAFGTERPALFVDVPRKAFNPEWSSLGLTPFEDRVRHDLGTVLAAEAAATAGDAASRLIADAASYAERIAEVRAREIYNFGGAARAGADLVDSLLGSGAGPKY